MVASAATTRSRPLATVAHLGSPTGGWNAVDNISNMAPTDAVRLDNWVCDTTNVRLRRGSVAHVDTDITTPIRSLMVYTSGATSKLLASGGGTSAVILDVSVPGTATPVASGLGSDVWQYVNFATPGGQFLIGVNGQALQYKYDGSTWALTTNTAGTGVVLPSGFACVAAFENRLFFTAPTGLGLYYLPVSVFQGEVHMIDLGGYLPLGGKIAELGTWTRDDGFGGMDDLLVVVSDQGEVLMFAGIDPDLADGWSFTGRFVVGKPVAGHRALAWLGPDMLLICEDGFQPLTRYLALGQSQSLTTQQQGVYSAISHKIGNAVSKAVKAGKTLFGWEATLYSANNIVIVNVPQPGGGFQQYVVNTITGAWSRFLGLNASCWAVYAGGIYFGSDNGLVVHADQGGDDLGQPIWFDLVTSFQLPEGSAQQKRATMCKPYLTANGIISPSLDVNVDYNIAAVAAPIETGIAGSLWDGFDWDAGDWGADAIVQNNWYSVQGFGNAFSIHMSGLAKCSSLQLFAFDITFETGVGFI